MSGALYRGNFMFGLILFFYKNTHVSGAMLTGGKTANEFSEEDIASPINIVGV